MTHFNDHQYFHDNDVYPESDGDNHAKTFYLAGCESPRFNSKADLMAVVERLHELQDIPTYDNIELAAGEVGAFTF